MQGFFFGAFSRVRAGLIASALLFMLGASPVRADILLDTFGPGDTHPGQIWGLFNMSSFQYQSLAVHFSVNSAQTITDILSSINGTGTYTINIVSDVSGLPNGSLLYSATLTNPVTNSLLSGLNWVIGAGDYWITSESGPGNSGGFWQGGGSVAIADWAFNNAFGTGGWRLAGPGDAPAVRIIATVPEPGTWWLMLAGVAFLGWQLRRRIH